MKMTDIYVCAIVLLAAYGLGTATNKLLGNDAPPAIYKRVHINTTSGCAL